MYSSPIDIKADNSGYQTAIDQLKSRVRKRYETILKKLKLNETQISMVIKLKDSDLIKDIKYPLFFTKGKYISIDIIHRDIKIFTPFGTLLERIFDHGINYITSSNIIYDGKDGVYKLDLKTLTTTKIFEDGGHILSASDDILIGLKGNIVCIIKDNQTHCVDKCFQKRVGKYLISNSKNPLLYNIDDHKYYRLSDMRNDRELKYIDDNIKKSYYAPYTVPIEYGVYASVTTDGKITLTSKTKFYDIHDYLSPTPYSVKFVFNIIRCFCREKLIVFKYKDDKLLFKWMPFHEIIEVSDDYFLMIQNKVLHKVCFSEFNDFEITKT